MATLEIPTDAEVSGFTGGAELEVSISGGDLERAGELQLLGGWLLDSHRISRFSAGASQITSQISGQQPGSELFVEVDTDATSESGVSLVLRRARARSRRISIWRRRASARRAVRVSRPSICRRRFPRVMTLELDWAVFRNAGDGERVPDD